MLCRTRLFQSARRLCQVLIWCFSSYWIGGGGRWSRSAYEAGGPRADRLFASEVGDGWRERQASFPWVLILVGRTWSGVEWRRTIK
jgi:hypothetical protein